MLIICYPRFSASGRQDPLSEAAPSGRKSLPCNYSWLLLIKANDASLNTTFHVSAMSITVGVLALQGAFQEHLNLLRKAAGSIFNKTPDARHNITFNFREVRTQEQLSLCDALIIPGGESTTISLVAARSNLLEPLRDFVK